MQGSELHCWATWLEIGLAPLTCAMLIFISAPYGRHYRPGWGPTLNSRVGWVLMESPALLFFVPIFFAGVHSSDAAPLVFLAYWLWHYLYRALVFPFRIRMNEHRIAGLVVCLGAMFNTLNAYIIARQLSQFGDYPVSWLTSPQFAIGSVMFAVGFVINRRADRTLLGLRSGAADAGAYKIPYGGLYRYVSCPNYLGEIIQWIGFAVLTWSLPALAFALYTVANLGPRALTNHAWYRKEFPDYPPERRALLPFLL